MSHATDIIAHRGASADAPENTLRAFHLAFAQNADGIELDIHLTRDSHIVVIHDDNTHRTTGVNKKVVDLTLDEIRELTVGGHEKIPTLDEVLAIVPKAKKLYIELKVHQEILPALAEALKRAPTSPDQTVIITFFLDTAAAAKQRFPNRKVYWLVGRGKDKKFPPIADIIARARGKVDGVDIDHNVNLDAVAVKKIHDAGLSCHVWTLDDATKAKALMSMGVDGITTNHPGALRAQIDRLR